MVWLGAVRRQGETLHGLCCQRHVQIRCFGIDLPTMALLPRTAGQILANCPLQGLDSSVLERALVKYAKKVGPVCHGPWGARENPHTQMLTTVKFPAKLTLLFGKPPRTNTTVVNSKYKSR